MYAPVGAEFLLIQPVPYCGGLKHTLLHDLRAFCFWTHNLNPKAEKPISLNMARQMPTSLKTGSSEFFPGRPWKETFFLCVTWVAEVEVWVDQVASECHWDEQRKSSIPNRCSRPDSPMIQLRINKSTHFPGEQHFSFFFFVNGQNRSNFKRFQNRVFEWKQRNFNCYPKVGRDKSEEQEVACLLCWRGEQIWAWWNCVRYSSCKLVHFPWEHQEVHCGDLQLVGASAMQNVKGMTVVSSVELGRQK